MKQILKHSKSLHAAAQKGDLKRVQFHAGHIIARSRQLLQNPGSITDDQNPNAPEPDNDEDNTMNGGHWIQGAIKHPGALHKELGVPQGETIPAKKLNAAANSDNPTLARRANLAKTLKKMHGGK